MSQEQKKRKVEHNKGSLYINTSVRLFFVEELELLINTFGKSSLRFNSKDLINLFRVVCEKDSLENFKRLDKLCGLDFYCEEYCSEFFKLLSENKATKCMEYMLEKNEFVFALKESMDIDNVILIFDNYDFSLVENFVIKFKHMLGDLEDFKGRNIFMKTILECVESMKYSIGGLAELKYKGLFELMVKFVKVNPNHIDDDGNSLSHYIFKNSFCPGMEFIHKYRDVINWGMKNRERNDPISVLFPKSSRDWFKTKEDETFIKFFIEDMNFKPGLFCKISRDKDVGNMLHYLVKHNFFYIEQLFDLLIELANRIDLKGKTPYHYACDKFIPREIHRLFVLNKNVKVDTECNNGNKCYENLFQVYKVEYLRIKKLGNKEDSYIKCRYKTYRKEEFKNTDICKRFEEFVKEQKTCSKCSENEGNIVFETCGHVFCTRCCIEQYTSDSNFKCHVCKSKVELIVDIS